jgi:surface-adhesin protein E
MLVAGRTHTAYYVGFWLLITLLALTRGSVYAEWVAVKKQYQVPGVETAYFDPDTIRQEGNRVTIWQLTDIKWLPGTLTPRLLSKKTHKQFDCVKHRLRVLAVTEFSRQMGTGKQADGYIENGNWMPVEPGSVNQALWEVACGKP